MEKTLSKLANFKYLLFILLAVGVFLRFYKLGSLPTGLVRDEASSGYNSWLLSRTGKDEWGETLPMHFRAFSEWKLPGYIYSLVPFVTLFGLNGISIRLLSALAGIGSVIAWYLIWSEKENQLTGLIGALFLLFSFWIFPIVRIGFQLNLAIFFFIFGWMLWVKKKYYLATLFLLGSVYTYNVFRILTPLFFAWLGGNLILKTKQMKKIGLFILFGLGCLPIVYFFMKEPTAFLRAQQTGIQEAKLTTMVNNYFNHLNPDFLIFTGDENLRHSPGVTGQLSFLAAGLAIVGLLKLDLTTAFLLLAGPLPAVITKISPHSLRSLGFMFGLYSLVTLGVSKVIDLYRQNKTKLIKGFIILVVIAGLTQYVYFYYDYFVNYPHRATDAWQTGYKQVYSQLDNVDQEIYFSWEYTQPYIYQLFYNKLNIFNQSVDVAPPDKWHLSRITRINNVHYLSCQELNEIFHQEQPAYFVLTSGCQTDLKEKQIIKQILINNDLRFIIATNETDKK
jgi:hypothetical protein